jgi:hypothetical protein
MVISIWSLEMQVLAGVKASGHKVVLNGGDENGQVLQGQDAVFENSKQWHETAFPSYLQSKKDDFCLNWESAMQVSLAHGEFKSSQDNYWGWGQASTSVG